MAVYVFSFLFLLSSSFCCFIIVLTIIRRPEAVKPWPGPGGPWGFWGGGGGSQWGSEVEGEERESWGFRLARESCAPVQVLPSPPPPPVSPHLPNSTWLLTTTPSALGRTSSSVSVTPCHASTLPTFNFSSPRGQLAVSLQSRFP